MPKQQHSYTQLGGIFKFYPRRLVIPQKQQSQTYPQPFFSFPKTLLVTFLISNILKLVIPFALQYLYLNITPTNIIEPCIIVFIAIVANYYFELTAEGVMNRHKLVVKDVLARRVVRNASRGPYERLLGVNPEGSKSSWSKIQANVNIYVNNYYTSYVTLVFETLKAMFIVVYLFNKLGWITFVGLFISGCIVQFIGFISKKIQDSNFKKLNSMDKKTKILTQYLTRIVDYQMSWLDGFIGQKVDKLENQYQTNLKRAKMLDAWCVGLWQFTQIGISSVVLCLYYFYYGNGTNNQNAGNQTDNIQPATIIYLFQMLTFPMNAISWHIAGLNNSQRALRQLSQAERDVQKQRKRQKLIQKLDYGYQITQIQQSLKHSKIYAVNSDDNLFFKKLALSLTKNGEKVGYAEENGFMLPTLIENLYMNTLQKLDSSILKSEIPKIASILTLVNFQQFPLQNLVNTFSGGQKMRLSLARAFMFGKYIIIDSDLTSLDRGTRGKVFTNIKEYVGKSVAEGSGQGVVVVIKARKGDQEMDRFVDQWVKVEEKYSRVKFQGRGRANKKSLNKQRNQSKNKLNSLNKRTLTKQNSPQKPKILQKHSLQQRAQFQQSLSSQKQLKILIQKIQTQISQLQTYQIFHPNQSKNSTLSPSPSLKALKTTMARKLNLSTKTLKFYFHHRIYHILFVFSLAMMYFVGNYYQYFVNVRKPDQEPRFVYIIMYVTVIYVVCIVLRSYLFAKANVLEAQRISKLVNKLVVFNHINFYDRFNIIQHQPQVNDLQEEETQYLMKKVGSMGSLQSVQTRSPLTSSKQRHTHSPNSFQSFQKSLNPQKLLTLATSDQTTITNSFPFSTNILWNNIATVIGSLAMIFMQVPEMIVFTIFFVLMIRKIQAKFRVFSEKLVLESKEQEARFMRSVNYVEQGAIYGLLYRRMDGFYGVFRDELTDNIENSNTSFRLNLWAKANFRINMVLFLLISIFLFWVKFAIFRNPESETSQTKQTESAKMSIMLRYILILADYIFYLTMSLAECRGQALSIERVRRFAQNQKVINGSFDRIRKSNRKRDDFVKALIQKEENTVKEYINLNNFTYFYDKRQSAIFQSINLKIQNRDRVVLKGKTGAGKTTLFKILMGLYPEAYYPQKSIKLIAFSSQHPLKLGQSSILQRLDPYKVIDLVPEPIKNKIMQKAKKIIQRQQKNQIPKISYQQEVLINNLRAYLYGFKGLVIYDQPQYIPDESDRSTYLIVTHHGKFKYTNQYVLQKGKLIQIKEQDNK